MIKPQSFWKLREYWLFSIEVKTPLQGYLTHFRGWFCPFFQFSRMLASLAWPWKLT